MFSGFFFPGPVLDYFSRNHISELSGSGFFLGDIFFGQW